jgi:uncharacterized membrane protein YuzA (DUF378 family)
MTAEQATELIDLTRAVLFAVGALTVGAVGLLALIAVRSFLDF